MKISAVVPQLRTRNLDSTIRFYTEKVGFTVEFRYQDFYAGLRNGAYVIHLKQVDDADPSVEWVAEAGHFHLYLETPDVDEVARRLRAAGVTLQCEPADTEWQTRELIFLDDQGHTIYVGQALSR